jgi:hypothetical protein
MHAQIGGMVLHEGRVAEMQTGEGKTLVATLPAYLNALTGRGVHIVTVNDYLAKRDAEWSAHPHTFMHAETPLAWMARSPADGAEVASSISAASAASLPAVVQSSSAGISVWPSPGDSCLQPPTKQMHATQGA